MQRILICGNDTVFNEALKEFLTGRYMVETTNNGTRALELISELEPDILCIDLHINNMDSISVIRNTRMSGRNIPIIVTAMSADEEILADLEQLRVELVCLKPLRIDYLANLIKGAMFISRNVQQKQLCLEDDLDLLLRDLGFRMGPERYNFIRCAILARYNQTTDTLMKNIYLDIADAFNAQYTNVEKAVRDAIKSAWRNGDPVVWKLYFSADGQSACRCPTNEEFITSIATILQKEGRRKKAFLMEKGA